MVETFRIEYVSDIDEVLAGRIVDLGRRIERLMTLELAGIGGGAFAYIEEINPTGGVSTFTFNSVSPWKVIIAVYSARDDIAHQGAQYWDPCFSILAARFNGDSVSVYPSNWGAWMDANVGNTGIRFNKYRTTAGGGAVGAITNDNAIANTFGNGWCWFGDCQDTDALMTYFGHSAGLNNNVRPGTDQHECEAFSGRCGGLWNSKAQVTSITFFIEAYVDYVWTPGQFKSGSRFTFYGM